MKKHYSIDQLATATTRLAQSQTAMLRRDLAQLRDSIANSSRAIKQPVIKAARGKTKRTTSTSVWAGIADIGAVELLNAGLLGDGNFKAGATAKVGGFSFTDTASSTGNSAYDSGSFYTSAAQAAGDQSDNAQLAQRIR